MRGHWRRLIIQIAILISMVVVYSFDDQIFTTIVSLSLIILPVVTWTVFAILLWLSRKAPEIESLRDRVDDALSAALASTAAAGVCAIVVIRLLGIITVPIAPLISVGIAFVLVTVSIPSLNTLPVAVRVWLPMVQRKQEEEP